MKNMPTVTGHIHLCGTFTCRKLDMGVLYLHRRIEQRFLWGGMIGDHTTNPIDS